MDSMITVAKMSDNVDFLKYAYELGVRNFRFNMDYEAEAIKSIDTIRGLGLNGIVLFADFQGVKMRIQLNPGVDEIICGSGQLIRFYTNNKKYPYISNIDLYSDYIEEGNHIIFADGKIEGVIVGVYTDSIEIRFVKVNYKLRQNAGCSISSNNIPTPHITPEICRKIKETVVIKKRFINWVILSFVESPEDIVGFINDMHSVGIKVMAKIETPTGVSNIHRIAPVVDGVMIGRGDLSSTSGESFKKTYNLAIDALTSYHNIYCGVGTFFLSQFSQTGEPILEEIAEIEELCKIGVDFIMLSKEVVNSHYPFQTIKYLQELLCQK